MCIYLGDVDGAVTEHLLDIADVNVSFEEAGREGVAEHVWGNVELDQEREQADAEKSPSYIVDGREHTNSANWRRSMR